MNRFSIKDIEVLTGIKSHTIRIWEQRYGIIKPKRTETNIRFYNNEDLKYLLNISLLNKMGYKISSIAKLGSEEIGGLIAEYSLQLSDNQNKLNAMVRCTLDLDETTFEKILSTEILENGIIKTMNGLIFPFLEHLGNLWSAGTVAPSYEHFIINLIKTKLLVAIDGLGYNKASDGKNKVLLFLPENESHEIGLLFANYLFKNYKHQTLYLGQNLPSNELVSLIENYKPDIIFTSMVCGHTEEKMNSTIRLLRKLSAKSEILISGSCFLHADLALPKKVHAISDYDSVKPYL